MKSWQERTLSYFYSLAALIVAALIALILLDSYKYQQISNSLNVYMGNLRDMIFMSTYDSLKKGNMKLFKSHMEEIGAFNDVYEFSLIDKKGIVHYSSNPALVKSIETEALGLKQKKIISDEERSICYFPVETTSYCARCHLDWKVGSVNSYYKLTLSSEALDAAKTSTMNFRFFTISGGFVLLAFIYMLFSLYERRNIEAQMSLSASVFENAVEAIAITSAQGVIEKINPAFTQMTGFAREDVIGKNIDILDAGDINKATQREMNENLRDEGSWTGEVWHLRKDGETFPVRHSITAVRTTKNQPSHYVSIFYDISVRKAAERALLKMDQVKSEFISTAAHELRTPLSAILGFTELLKDADKYNFDKNQKADFLDEIYDRGEALNQIVDDLLDVGRIESGKPIDLKIEMADLFELLQRVIGFYRVHDLKHTFSLALPDSNDKREFLIDRHRIKQVLENLLNNASKYSAAGTEIRLSCHFRSGKWEIVVADHGIGMTPEQVDRVFEKFYRADSSNTAASGFGLGMSIAKQIIEIHGGNIWVESVQGEGTRATFTLPYVLT